MRINGEAPNKAAVVSFLVGDTHPYDVGMILDKLGVAVRTGHHYQCTTHHGQSGHFRYYSCLFSRL